MISVVIRSCLNISIWHITSLWVFYLFKISFFKLFYRNVSSFCIEILLILFGDMRLNHCNYQFKEIRKSECQFFQLIFFGVVGEK